MAAKVKHNRDVALNSCALEEAAPDQTVETNMIQTYQLISNPSCRCLGSPVPASQACGQIAKPQQAYCINGQPAEPKACWSADAWGEPVHRWRADARWRGAENGSAAPKKMREAP